MSLPKTSFFILGGILFMKVSERIQALRQLMIERGMDAYIVPTDDFHASEYVGDYFKSRKFMTGFTGSAATLVVLKDKAAMWTDGRYFLQAGKQLEGSTIELMKSGQPGVPTIPEFLAENLEENNVIGFDGRTVNSHFVNEIDEKTSSKQIRFVGEEDLVDLVWKERPEMSKKPVWEVDVKYAGLSREEKLASLREEMKTMKADVLVETALDDIAWLLNLRGDDISYSPVFLSYMLISQEKAILCVHEEIISKDIKEKLGKAGVMLSPYESIAQLVREIPKDATVLLDKGVVNYQLINCLPKECKQMDEPSPIVLMKAKKTKEEMENLRIAHVKDGVAVTKFIYWLKHQVGKEKITELDASKKIANLRAEREGFIGLSFESIIAYGPHGAIVHYGPTPETDIEMKPSSFCLADTGGHYEEGTTDITRTIALGELTEEEKRAYTLVLRGHLNLAAAKFMHGVCGANLDYIAREPLWENNLDFNHGTGHGVGYLLNVHEGPQRIHWNFNRIQKAVPFEEGMVVSDEPGLYLTNKFGIRHENLLLCHEGEKNEYGQFMYFENLTKVPFDKDAIDVSLMTETDIERLNSYHKDVYKTISPYLEGDELEWLKEVTAAL
jgi:Xaa-Pro aminopeptidase